MKKTSAKLLVLLAATSLCLTGCSGSKENTENGVVEEQTQGGTVSLRIWGSEEDGEMIKAITQKFAAQYSDTNFEFTIEGVAESDCKGTMLNDVNNGADVITFADDQLAILAASGVLKPIQYNVDEVKSRNSAGSVEAASVNGELYAYPLTADNGYFLYYDKSVFTAEDIMTMDSILAKAQAAGKKVSIPVTNGWYFYAFYGNTGLTLTLNDDGISNICDWNSTENAITGLQVTEAIRAITSNSAFVDGNDDILKEGVLTGAVAAGISGVWLANDMQAAFGENYGAVKLPTYTVAGKQVQMASYAGYKMVGINSYSKNTEWAEKFAEFLSNEENQTLRFETRAQGPSNTNAASSQAVQSSLAIQALLQQSEYSSLQRVGGKYWGAASDLGNALVSGTTPGGVDWQEFLDSIVAEITASNS